jgi:hypothetical protein
MDRKPNVVYHLQLTGAALTRAHLIQIESKPKLQWLKLLDKKCQGISGLDLVLYHFVGSSFSSISFYLFTIKLARASSRQTVQALPFARSTSRSKSSIPPAYVLQRCIVSHTLSSSIILQHRRWINGVHGCMPKPR